MEMTTTSGQRVLRVKELSSTIGLAKSTIYDYLDPKSRRHDPSFPKPFKITDSAVGWSNLEVEKWIQAKIDARDAPK